MTTLEELERAVERLTRAIVRHSVRKGRAVTRLIRDFFLAAAAVALPIIGLVDMLISR